ncbi:hypothetical protein FOE78_02220 [Microlunatus elymi]|uniref:Uncharacterized protein n=1 Tax=Microlunatus elymi TaxID=2596828 RepID=A0A516PUL4_9ACTN|nr:hypothetical protein [Microlunatus elymi]QDP94888.1 hypothetical protein FOE78_02220 [Microlunatus elymi]
MSAVDDLAEVDLGRAVDWPDHDPLVTIGGLERALRHRLSDSVKLHRALVTSVGRSTRGVGRPG